MFMNYRHNYVDYWYYNMNCESEIVESVSEVYMKCGYL